MSRWESLKSEKGQERGRRNNDSGLGRSNRWASFNSNAKHESSRQQNHKSSFRGRQQHQRQYRGTKDETGSLSKIEPVKNDDLQIVTAEHDAILNSLKSKLIRYQSEETNEDHKKSVAIENLTRLLRGITNLGHLLATDEQPYNTDVFMAFVDFLKVDTEQKDLDDGENLSLMVARAIESCLKVSEAGSKTNTLTNIRLSKSRAELGVTTLSSHYHKCSVRTTETQSPMASSLLVAIALLTKNNVCQLPPESTARHIVGAIFIPYLSSLRPNRDQPQGQDQVRSSNYSSSSRLLQTKCVCEATIALLENPSHASAILAPLVEDFVSPCTYGVEEQTINPLKMELLSVLLGSLEMHSYQENDDNRRIEQVGYVCHTLSATIDGIRKLKKGNEIDNAARNDPDAQIVKPIQKFILDAVTEYNNMTEKPSEKTIPFENLLTSSLQVLRAVVASYPTAVTGAGWKLIIEGASRNVTCESSSTVASTYLPNLLMTEHGYDTTMFRSERSSENLLMVMDCIADFILVLPWKKWLKQIGTRTPTMMPTKTITSGLYKTVVDALVSLIGISKNVFCKCSDKSQMKSLGRLIKAIMVQIPYCDLKLIRAGEDLWKAIAKCILDSQKFGSVSFREEKQNLACEVLVDSSGGTTTPQGNMLGMSIPARTWFLSNDSSAISFFQGLLDSFQSKDGRYHQTVRLLSSILRTLPDIALRRWDIFLQNFQEIEPGSNKKDLMRMEVLESFMLGRKDFEVSAELKSKNERIITDLDGIMLKRWNQNNLQRCMSIYSSFRSQDWIQLDQTDGRVSCHLDNILSCCQNSSAKIREGAARAVGEFCSQYVQCDTFSRKPIEESKMRHYQLLVYKVSAAMLELCRDKNAGARAMSIFSLGNLVCALKAPNTKEILETARLQEMHKSILSSFNDTNDKVVKNAIRSVGHTSNLLVLSLRRGGCDEYISISYALLVETIESLTSKLWNTLHVALNEEQKASMTWKERSAAKKHGWGACHSLGLVFEGLWFGIFEDCDELALTCSKAAQCLVRCPCQHSVLNEKVVLAAMAAICHLPSQFFVKNDSQSTLLGNALTASILILESSTRVDVPTLKVPGNNSRITPKLATQNEQFLLHLLNSASIADATIVLSDDRITTHILGVLYSWMVEGPRLPGLSARAFEVFALALGRWSASVEFEQKFTSRALQKQKQERISMLSPSSDSSSPEQNANDDDEADEL